MGRAGEAEPRPDGASDPGSGTPRKQTTLRKAAGGGPSTLRRAAWLFVQVAIAVVLLVVIRLLLVQSFVIPSASMTPTLQPGDRVLVSRVGRHMGEVHRGDVIVFDGDGVFTPATTRPSSALARMGRAVASGLGAPVGEHDYAKRVIGLPGDHVVCCDTGGRLTVNGTALNETYLAEGTAPSTDTFDVVVPSGRLWVMGDNRGDSADSRAHLGDPGGGTVSLDRVVGRVVTVWWPLGRATGVGSPDPAQTTPTG